MGGFTGVRGYQSRLFPFSPTGSPPGGALTSFSVVDGVRDAIQEASLVAALRAGEESAFRDLVLRHHAALVQLARASVTSQAVAEEVVRDTWGAVIRGIGNFDGRSSLKVWIFSIALKAARKRAAEQPQDSDRGGGSDASAVNPDRFIPEGQRWAGHWCAPPMPWTNLPAQRLIGQEAVAAVVRVIDELPARQREVVTLRDVEGWTAAEVCALLGISEAGQRALLHRGRSRVRAKLEDLLGA